MRKGKRRERERAMIKKRTSKKSDILLQMMGGLDFGFIHIGDAILAEIDDERHVAIGLANGTTANRWEGIRLKLVSKKQGLLDICESPSSKPSPASSTKHTPIDLRNTFGNTTETSIGMESRPQPI